MPVHNTRTGWSEESDREFGESRNRSQPPTQWAESAPFGLVSKIPRFLTNLGTTCLPALYPEREMPRRDPTECPLDAIAAVRDGSVESFRMVVENYQQRVFRVCSHLLRDPARAEDLAQDTFLTALRKIGQFDPDKGSFAVWLITIARRLCLNAMKKSAPLHMAEPPDPGAPRSQSPDRIAARSDTFRALDRALADLSDEHRRAFVFAEIEELTYDEIAAIEGIATGTVKSRVSRAKLALQGSLRPAYEELDHEL